MAAINVLMCGGRRTGKTSIMAAIQDNTKQMFPRGDIVLQMDNAGELINYRIEQTRIFGHDYDDKDTFIANQASTGDISEYRCSVYLKSHKAKMDLNFTDVPGEWFIKDEYKEDLEKKMQNSQVLIIAVDSPHLMEQKGKYHEVFNRGDILTQKIKRSFQGNQEPRMVLFVPVKCERYAASPEHPKNRMPELANRIKDSYADLISYLTSDSNKNLYTIAITPCFTFGGAEFLRFVPPFDEDGNIELGTDGKPLKDMELDTQTNLMVMTYLTEYALLLDADGDHYYEPRNCEQSLIYILLFLISVSQMKTDRMLSKLWSAFLRQPSRKDLNACKEILLEKVNKQDQDGNAPDGFLLLSDPNFMVR